MSNSTLNSIQSQTVYTSQFVPQSYAATFTYPWATVPMASVDVTAAMSLAAPTGVTVNGEFQLYLVNNTGASIVVTPAAGWVDGANVLLAPITLAASGGSILLVITALASNKVAVAVAVTAAVKGVQSVTAAGSVTVAALIDRVHVNPAALLASVALTMPAAPADNDSVSIVAGGTIAGNANVVTTFSVAPNAGHTLYQQLTPTSLKGGDVVSYRFDTLASRWIRIL